MAEVMIDTKNTDTISRLSLQAAKNKDWLIVIGEVGAGKSTLYKELGSFFREKKTKYRLIDFGVVMETSSTSVSSIISTMLNELSSEDKFPRNGTARLELLKELIRKVNAMGQRIVLLFDESQNISTSTLRDIKKLHELNGLDDKLFSIIMFAKNSTSFEKYLTKPEVGWRVLKTHLYNLENSEIVKIATDKFKVKFESGKSGENAKLIFISNVRAKTPLGVRQTLDLIKASNPKFNGVVTEESIKKALNISLRSILDRYKISLREISRIYKENTGKEIDKSVIQRIINGNESKSSRETVNNVFSATIESINNVGVHADDSVFFKDVMNG